MINMDNNINNITQSIDQMIRKMRTEINKLNEINALIQQEKEYPKSDIIDKYLITTELNLIERRKLYNLCCNTPYEYETESYPNEINDKITETLGFKIDVTKQGWYHILMPKLANKKTVSKGKYMRKTWSAFFKSYIQSIYDNGENFPNKIEKVTVIFVHHISNNGNSWCKTDADNVDVKFVIDQLSLLFFYSDSTGDCDIYHTSKTDNQEITEVYLVPQSEFTAWIIQHF